MIELKNLRASYKGGSPVISDISLRVGESEICAILGANGAGKSTLLRSIMGLVPQVSGTINGPGGVPLGGLRTFEIARRGIAYVPEGRGILYSLDIRENLLIGTTALLARHGHDAAERIDRVLGFFPILKQRLGQRAGSLSGGQQQMLAIGRALVSNPMVLLLDEPSLGLAPLVRREIADILIRIRQEQKIAVLLVEQDIKLAQACVSRAVILRQGQLIDELSLDELAHGERLRHAYLGIGKVPA